MSCPVLLIWKTNTMTRELEWFTTNMQSWIMLHNICFCRKEVMLQIFHGFFSCESHLYSDCSCFTRNPWAVLELQLHFSWSCDKSSSCISTSTNLQPQSEGVKFHWTSVMNIFIHVVKLGHLKTSVCVLSHLYSWLCVVMTWSVVFLSSWPMKHQEKVCGFG